MSRNITFAVAVLACTLGFPKAEATSGSCDRECLKGFVTQYINSLIAHKPESLSVAANVRCTENNKEIKLGEGQWKTASGLGDYRVDVLDPVLGNAVSFFIVNSNVGIAVRLRVENKKITQIETMVASGVQASTLKAASTMNKAIDQSKLNSRDEIIKMAELYAQGLRDSTCKTFKNVNIPFAGDCYRIENGMHTAGVGSKSLDMLNQVFPEMPDVFDRLAAADVKTGIAVLRLNFGNGSIDSKNQQHLELFEAFRTYGDSMHAVEAFMRTIPANQTRTAVSLFGWDYNFTPTGILKGEQSQKTGKSPGAVITSRGVFIGRQIPSDMMHIDIYDISGRLVHTKYAAPAAASISVPFGTLPPGPYIGRVRYRAGGKEMRPPAFPMDFVR
jgi:hypothetical protein